MLRYARSAPRAFGGTGGRVPPGQATARFIDIAIVSTGDDRRMVEGEPRSPTFDEVVVRYARGMLAGATRRSVPGRLFSASTVSRLRSELSRTFIHHRDLCLRNVYFVGHGVRTPGGSGEFFELSGRVVAGQYLPSPAGLLRAPGRGHAASDGVWRTLRGQMLLAQQRCGEVEHTIEFRCCNVGRAYRSALAEYFPRPLEGRIWSPRSPTFQLEWRSGGRRGSVYGRVGQDGDGGWTRPSRRPPRMESSAL